MLGFLHFVSVVVSFCSYMNIYLEEGTQSVKALERGSFQIGALDRIAVIAVDFGSLN